ncbi:hypothetical protein VNO77_33985 [Canavalia gladiata]|uniref:Uncharacterized protein n=1 Tax=Canavalia gladiata TaxID=3824 RepID=A0AAN9PYW1_CANGL
MDQRILRHIPQVSLSVASLQWGKWDVLLSGNWLAYRISKPGNYSSGANVDQRLVGLLGANADQGIDQGTTAVVLMWIRGWLTYWISRPGRYSSGADVDQRLVDLLD